MGKLLLAHNSLCTLWIIAVSPITEIESTLESGIFYKGNKVKFFFFFLSHFWAWLLQGMSLPIIHIFSCLFIKPKISQHLSHE